MPVKKHADLSPGLVAVKGEAVPVDARGRRAVVEEQVPLNFRVPASLRREFKIYAARHDMKLNELFRVCFEAYRRDTDASEAGK